MAAPLTSRHHPARRSDCEVVTVEDDDETIFHASENRAGDQVTIGDDVDYCACTALCEVTENCNTINYRAGKCMLLRCPVCYRLREGDDDEVGNCALQDAVGWEVHTTLRQVSAPWPG